MDLTKGQWIFITQLNQFRTKNVHSMTSEAAYWSISELLRIVLDVIHQQVDTYVAVTCLLLSSTFYYNPASIGGVNQKKYLFELIANHPIWQDHTFWERAIQQQIEKEMNKHQEMSTFESEIGKAETWESANAEERVQRLNEITFAALSSL